MTSCIQPLMDHIIESDEKWRVIPEEYDNQKRDWIKRGGDIEKFDEYFNANFIILTEDEIKLREERIQKRDLLLQERKELFKQKETIEHRLQEMDKESKDLLRKINWED